MSLSVEKMLLGNRPQIPTQKKHEKFAISYMTDFDLVRAYKEVYDEDGKMEDIVAHKAAARLLKSVVVQRVMDDETCKYISQKRLEKDQVILKLQRIYYDAMRDRDYTSALGALDKLMKHFGMFQEHNKQKRYGVEEITAIRRKLEENGIQFDAPNRPLAIEDTTLGYIEDAVVEEEKV